MSEKNNKIRGFKSDEPQLQQNTEVISKDVIISLLDLDYSPFMVSLWSNLLSSGRIDPNQLLYILIPIIDEKKHLIPIALALRFGANPNSYYEIEDSNMEPLGTGHILLYIYKSRFYIDSLKDPLINSIVIMLFASGCKTVLPCFDTKGGSIRKGTDSHYNSQSVKEWLTSNNINTIVPQIEKDFDSVDISFKNYLGAILNSSSLSTPPQTGGDIEYFDEIIKCKSDNLTSKCFESKEIKRLSDGLRISIENLNLNCVEKFLQEGHFPNYLDMNAVIISLQNIKEFQLNIKEKYDISTPLKDGNIFKEGIDILKKLVQIGGSLDRYQLDVLINIDGSLADDIVSLYSEPYWKKTCSNKEMSDEIPPQLLSLAYNLNIDPFTTKDYICKSISKLAESNPEELKAAAIKKQMLRIGSSTGSTRDFISKANTRGNLLCRNRSLFDSNPYEYNDLDLSYYKDEKGILWCFTSDMIESLLKHNKNPYTDEPLPESYIISLKSQRNTLKRLGFAVGYTPPVKTFSEGFDSLSNIDTISNDETNRISEYFFKSATINGIDISSLKIADIKILKDILKSVGIDEPQLNYLPEINSRVTFYRISSAFLRSQPDCIPSFFSDIRAKLLFE